MPARKKFIKAKDPAKRYYVAGIQMMITVDEYEKLHQLLMNLSRIDRLSESARKEVLSDNAVALQFMNEKIKTVKAYYNITDAVPTSKKADKLPDWP